MAPLNKPTKKWIDKKSATTFQVRYRSQNDPLIHDETATDFVLTEVDAPNAHKSTNKIKTAADLENELDVTSIRKNEGEAAMYGIYYDDTKYDYMQHMREMGGSTEAVFIEAPQAASKQRKGKKQTLDEAIFAHDQPKSTVVHIPKELLPSEQLVKKSYQDMQDVPDALAGFQPDMDPRLREVLEALEDDAYVDDDEDIFAQLAEGGETSAGDFFDQGFEEEEDDGWASDATEKAPVRPSSQPASSSSSSSTTNATVAEEDANADWMKEFSKFKKAQKKEKKEAAAEDDGVSSLADTMSFGGSSAMTGGTISVSGRRRRRREKKAGGARTATSGYSMSSSALFRTEGLTLLDDRFDKIEEEYAEDSEEEERNGVVPETRKDFDAIMDEFLSGYTMTGQRSKTHRVKRGKNQSGLDQLDEIRRELASARIR
ncbi:Low temperature viability protein [Sphaerosporella brunnea]|uniref:Low temperature viability protein n=1 Tax=Sphaerosporella brunnea TaxID=1250544 RepID=A0A5J5F4K4_9PEZI|nr:Low temperature viability protein [Sphaerosporella brunnea]